MAGLLSQWIKDSEKFEMQRSYHVLDQDNYAFLNRQADFYITLLNKMFFLLEEVEDGNYAARTEELLEVAKGLAIYSDKDTQTLFEHIDKRENMLYVAAVYYLAGYEAIASLLLKDCQLTEINNTYGKLIAYLIRGGNDDYPETEDSSEKDLFESLEAFLSFGIKNMLEEAEEHVLERCDKMEFASLDEFFDCYVFKHVLRKFTIDNLWYDLKRAEPEVDWSDYVDYSRSQGILQFLPSQRDAIQKGLLTYEHSFSLKMPTSAGKSYITELLIYSELQKNPDAKVLYLAPLRSLSHELSERYEMVGKALGFDSFAAYGGNSSTLDSNKLEEASLFITTPEFFASMEGGDEELLDKFTLVICDEGQLLDSLTRGTNYELLLSRIKSRGVARFLFISAIIPNIEDVNTWLGGSDQQVGDSRYRPCEIKLAMAEKIQRNVCLHVYSPDLEYIDYNVESFLNRRENVHVGINSKITRSVALGLKSVSAGSTLIFTYSKGGRYGCERVCNELENVIETFDYGSRLIDDGNRNQMEMLHEYVSYQYGAEYPLSRYLHRGFAYHNGGLPQDVRECIEDYYRKKWLKILVSNSTLAEGVNLPIRTLVVYHLRRYNNRTQSLELIPSTEIRNIVGRVGRAGREKYGLVILPDDNQEVFDTVVEAMKGDGIHAIRGIFYEVIQLLSRNLNQPTDEEVNEILVDLGASSAIDQMIYRHYGGAEVDVVEESISDSLAFHLSDNNSKEYIRQAFRVRKDRIDASITSDEQLALLKQTGMELEDFMQLENNFSGENLDGLNSEDVVDEEWLNKVLSLIYTFPTIQPEYNYLSQDVKDIIEDKEIYAAFLKLWLIGKQYWQIAEELDLPVDDVMTLLGHLQYHFHMRLQGLIRYLSVKYEFSDDCLSLLPECIKYGICNEVHTALIKSGLRDRIALHKVAQYVDEHEIGFSTVGGLKRKIRRQKEDLEAYLALTDIPRLSKLKIEKWIA
jgi:replicative superfamily II helicase